MRTRHIKHVDGPAGLQRIGAEHDHFLTAERSIEFVLVVAELLPMFRSYPERISAHPDPIVAFGQGRAELLAPTAGDLLEIELVALKVPFAACDQLDLPRLSTAVITRNCAPQRNRIGDGPYAKFVALQPRFDIANGGV